MAAASLSRKPVAPVSRCLSEPAKSIWCGVRVCGIGEGQVQLGRVSCVVCRRTKLSTASRRSFVPNMPLPVA